MKCEKCGHCYEAMTVYHECKMTEKEKELINILRNVFGVNGSLKYEDAVKALIQRYPQILAEKVFSGWTKDVYVADGVVAFPNLLDKLNLKDGGNIEVFIREVKE